MIGRTVAQYRIEAEIGRGGMGVVYRARDLRLEREVAIKVVSPELTRDPEFRRRLVREAQAAARLAHPAVCVIHAVEEVESTTLIAMELIRGEALARRLAEGALEPEAGLDLAIEVAEALAEAHDCDVVHRDLKPGNVMLTASGHAKIIDFGLAQRTAPRHSLDSGADTPARAVPGELLGTAAYMSPEQATGAPVDRRTDIFSFGSLLQEILTGRAPFLRPTAVETLHAVLKDPAPRLPELGPAEAVAELQRILDKCLAKPVEQRYATAGDLVVDLRSARRRLVQPSAPSPVAPEAGPLRVLVVDDEEPARALLREYLGEQSDVTLVGECRNGFEAVKAVAAERPDVVFLDVQMPKLNGFEVAELLGDEQKVVFVTAYDEHAVRAFEVNAVDYLLKPVSAERFAAALDRVRSRAGRPTAPAARLAEQARPEPAAHLERILVRDGPTVHVLPVDRLDYAQGRDDYVGLHSEGRELLKQQRLAELEESLDPNRFVRIHRSYLLNVDRLASLEIEERDRRVAVLRDGTRLPVSRAGYARLKQLL